MNLSNPSFLTTLLCFLIHGLVAQDINQRFDKVYGMDPGLYNGVVYKYFLQKNAISHQFLSGPEYMDGSVRIKGVTYTNVQLNYDIFNQQLLLKGQGSIYANTIISLSQAWLEGFSLGTASFEVIRFGDTSQRICQVSGNTYIRVLTYWTKEQKLAMNYLTPDYIFSSPKKEAFLQSGPDITKFRNNRSFISGFKKPAQTAISEYMRQHKVNVKKADADSMQALITFCNTLPR